MDFRLGPIETPVHLNESLLDIERRLDRLSAQRTAEMIILAIVYSIGVFLTRSELVTIWGGVLVLAIRHVISESNHDARFALGVRSLLEVDRNHRQSAESVERAIRTVRSLDP